MIVKQSASNQIDFRKYSGILIIIMLAVVFYPVFHKLSIMGWEKADYTHGVYILPISLWLLFLRRGELKQRIGFSAAGLAVFLIGQFCYIFSEINDFMFLRALSFVFTIWGIALSRYTSDTCKRIAFPLVYLLFLVPPPQLVIDMVTYPLKEISSKGSYYMFQIIHLPISMQGAILKVGNYDFFVADACSGFRSMVTLLALGSLYAYFQKTTIAKKWVIFLSVIPLGIAGNTFRIFITGCIANFIGIKYAEGFFHEFSGAVIFVIAILGLVFITDRLTRKHAVK